jgi:hypothetical protein
MEIIQAQASVRAQAEEQAAVLDSVASFLSEIGSRDAALRGARRAGATPAPRTAAVASTSAARVPAPESGGVSSAARVTAADHT